MVTEDELALAYRERTEAEKAYFRLARAKLHELAREVGGVSAMYLGVNVHVIQGSTGYESVTVYDILGIYDADCVRIGTEDEFDSDFDQGWLATIARHDNPDVSNSSTYAYNLETGIWRLDMRLREAVLPLTEALDLAIFAIRTWQEPQASSNADIADLDAKANLVVARLHSLREYVVAQGEDLVIE